MPDLNLNELTNEELAKMRDDLGQLKKKLLDDIKSVDLVILQRMTDNNSNALPTQGYKVSRKITKYDYDIDTLYAQLGEILTPDELDRIFINVPSYRKVDGTQIRSIMSQYGEDSEIASIILANRGNMNPILTIKKLDS